MINKHYVEFKVRDYMENEGIEIQNNPNLLDCSLGTNPFIDDELVKTYIQKGTCEINKYPITGYNRLKKELLKFWSDKSHNANISEKNISFGSGTMGILRNISELLIGEGTYVLGYSPQFPRFISEVELKRGIYEYYSLKEENNYKFEVEEFLKYIEDKYNMIYIDNPNNPTGQIIDLDNIERIVKKAKQYNITVVIDEAYGEYMKLENSAISLINKYDNIVVLRSASKFFGLPNHRIGYLFADEEFIKVYNEVTIPFAFSDLSANIFSNMIKDYEKFKEANSKIIEGNKKIYDELAKDNYLYTNFETPIFTIRSKKYKDLSKKLLEKSVISESCDNFINLDNTFTRIRISNKYNQLIKVFKDVLC